MTDFREKQISKLQAAIAKLKGKSQGAVELVRLRYEAKVAEVHGQSDEACERAEAKFQQQIDVLEKQLKALGGSR